MEGASSAWLFHQFFCQADMCGVGVGAGVGREGLIVSSCRAIKDIP